MDKLKDGYLLSFLAYEEHTATDKPEWWEFWREEQSYKYRCWVRYVKTLTREQGAIMLGHDSDSPLWRLIMESLSGGDTFNNVQLENLPRSAIRYHANLMEKAS